MRARRSSWTRRAVGGALLGGLAAARSDAPSDTPNGDYGGYLTWPEFRSRLGELQRRHPDLVQLHVLGKTVEGREIPLVRLSAPGRENPQAEVLVTSGMHPREQQPQLAVMEFLDDLTAALARPGGPNEVPADLAVWVAPILNVDGKVHDFQAGNGRDRGADWRKNRSRNRDGTRGVDLNRNFAPRWGGNRAYQEAWRSATDRPAGNIYEGPSPLSEPESRSLAEFLERRPLRAFLDLHSPFRKLFHPSYLIPEEHARYRALAARMVAAQREPYPVTNSQPGAQPGSGARSGDTGVSYHHAYYLSGVYGFNLEIGLTGRYPPPEAILEEYRTNLRGPLFEFLRGGAVLPLRQPGQVRLLEATTTRPAGAGMTVEWMPRLDGTWEYAVLTSESPAAVVLSEYRTAPLLRGFTLTLTGAGPGTSRVPLVLYVWDRERRRTVIRTHLDLAGAA